MITLSILLVISVGINILLIWYCRRLTKQFLFFTENIGELEAVLGAFDTHLTDVHELETFYGDDTLGGLIAHSKSVVDRVKDFYEGFALEEEGEEEDEEIDGSS